MRIPVTSQLALLVLSFAAWSAWAPARPPTAAVSEQEAETLTVFVENAFGPTWVDVCGTKTRAVDIGDQRSLGYVGVAMPGGVPSGCRVEAERSDGDYVAESAAVRVGAHDLRGSITLSLPAHRIGGIGVRLDERDGAVYVDRVYPHGAAREAGLRAGDLLLTGDGRQVHTVEEAQAVLLGPEGTSVDVRYARPANANDLELRGATLERRSDVQ